MLVRLWVTGAVPSESTIHRLGGKLAADRIDAVIGAWMWLRTSTIRGRRVISFDGKTVKGGATAQAIRDGHYVLTVKRNQPGLHTRVKSLPWKDIPVPAVALPRSRRSPVVLSRDRSVPIPGFPARRPSADRRQRYGRGPAE